MKARATMAATVLAMATLGAAVNPAQAQNALGDGRGLDANLQQGSGGVNQPARIGGPINTNPIVTGNVTGSSFFRDNVGYRAPGDFTDISSDDELFRFRAVSQPSSIPAITSRTFGQRMAPDLYFRDISGVTAADVRVDGGTPAAIWRARAAQDSLFDTGTITGSILTTGRRPSGAAGTLGYFESTDGRLMELTASPLFGVSGRPIEIRLDDLQLDRTLTRPTDAAAPQIDPQDLQAQLPTGFIEPVRWGAEPVADPLTAEMLGLPSPLLAPSMEIGLQLQEWTMQRLGEQAPEQMQQRVQRLESSIFRPLESMQAAPGEDVYVDLLRMLREGTQAPAEQRQRPQIDLERPSEQQLNSAEQMRQRALDALRRGLGPEEPGQPPALPQVPQPVEELVQRLDADLPTLGTLAGNRQDLANQHMREAELALADGRYFDAERRYERVLRLRPGYPLARVGLMHSQLGAGMIRSAALNLRNIFAAHPELIAVRYDTNLLPSEERLQWVRSELDSIIERTEQQYPALMLAYLGYQTSNRELVQYGLDLAQARDPADPLIPLLRRIWLDEGPAQQAPQNENADAADTPEK